MNRRDSFHGSAADRITDEKAVAGSRRGHEIISTAILLPSEIISSAILLPSADWVVVSYERNYVHEVLVNRLVKLALE